LRSAAKGALKAARGVGRIAIFIVSSYEVAIAYSSPPVFILGKSCVTFPNRRQIATPGVGVIDKKLKKRIANYFQIDMILSIRRQTIGSLRIDVLC
jgi:hypothetical protein